MIRVYFISLLIIFSNITRAVNNSNYAPETISTQSLVDFKSNPPAVKNTIEMALELAGRNIGYKYGSSDPNSGGMDCSGTIYYLLTKQGVKPVPRSSDSLYQWILKEGNFYPTNSNDMKTINLSHLKPGDLLFWTGTYQAPGNSYVTHVMMYLGKNKDGDYLMVGASDGRTYKRRQIYGVSVFDFILPSPTSKSKFIGYSCIPQLTCEKDKKN